MVIRSMGQVLTPWPLDDAFRAERMLAAVGCSQLLVLEPQETNCTRFLGIVIVGRRNLSRLSSSCSGGRSSRLGLWFLILWWRREESWFLLSLVSLDGRFFLSLICVSRFILATGFNFNDFPFVGTASNNRTTEIGRKIEDVKTDIEIVRLYPNEKSFPCYTERYLYTLRNGKALQHNWLTVSHLKEVS